MKPSYMEIEKAISETNENIAELKENIKPNIAKGIAEAVVTNSGTNKIIKLSEEILIGNKLSFTTDGGIKIGQGVHHVKVSGNIRVKSNVNNTRAVIQLNKNQDNAFVSNTIYCSTAGTEYGGAAAETLISVEAGNVIYLSYYNSESTVVTLNATLSSMTVEVVN